MQHELCKNPCIAYTRLGCRFLWQGSTLQQFFQKMDLIDGVTSGVSWAVMLLSMSPLVQSQKLLNKY